MAKTREIISVSNITKTVYQYEKYSLPKTVTAAYNDHTTANLSVTWDKKTVSTKKLGTYVFYGKVKGYSPKVKLTLKVITKNKPSPTPTPLPIPTYEDFKLLSISRTEDVEKIAYNGTDLYVAVGSQESRISIDGKAWTSHSIDLNADGSRNFELNDLSYEGKFFFAVGYGTYPIHKSTDGVNWKHYDLGNKEYDKTGNLSSIRNIIWDGKKYIAVGYYYSNSKWDGEFSIWTSSDGSKWKRSIMKGLSSDININKIMFINDSYYCLGYIQTESQQQGLLMSSTDSLKWTKVKVITESTSLDSQLYDISYNGKTYVALGAYGHTMYSYDLKKWIVNEDQVGGSGGKGNGIYIVNKGTTFIIYTHLNFRRWNGNGLFVHRSDDGITWNEFSYEHENKYYDEFGGLLTTTETRDEIEFIDNEERNIIYNLLYVTRIGEVLYAITVNNDILISDDGINWSISSKSKEGNHFIISHISYAGNKYFATSGHYVLDISSAKHDEEPIERSFYVSENGIDWTDYSKNSPDFVDDIFWNGNNYLCYNYDWRENRMKVYNSLDGINWEGDDCNFIDSNINFSSDDISYGFEKVSNVNGIFIMFITSYKDTAPYKGYIYSSTDGLNWSLSYTGDKYYIFNDVAYGNGQYVILGSKYNGNWGSGSIILTTKDLKTFNKNTFKNKPIFLNGIFFENKEFFSICVENEGYSRTYYLMISKDGVSWNKNKIEDNKRLAPNNIIHTQNYYFVSEPAPLNRILVSSNGAKWYELERLYNISASPAIFWNGEMVITGTIDQMYVFKP